MFEPSADKIPDNPPENAAGGRWQRCQIGWLSRWRGLAGCLANQQVSCLNSMGSAAWFGEQDVRSNRAFRRLFAKGLLDRFPGRLGFDPASAITSCGRRSV